MVQEMPVQLHLWPWSANNPERYDGHYGGESVDLMGYLENFPYYGSPVISVSKDVSLFLPARHERFVPLGPSYNTIHGEYQLYEVPYGVFGAKEKGRKSSQQYITVRSLRTNKRINLRPVGARDQDKRLKTIITAWYQQFEILIKKTEEEHFLLWENLEKYFLPEDLREDEPRMALIVKIAHDMDQNLQMIVFAARKILLRERKMVPMARVAEMDTSCLKWLGRQPGSDFAQKAAMHKHQLLGVVRYESFDTLENKILKDFLKRCEQAADHYIENEVGDNQTFQKSSRAKRVKGFRQLCRMLHAVPHLEDVSSPPLSFIPNYVLQNDYRYRQIWHHYLRLLRSEEEKDQIWDWQNRTWSDLVRIMICLTLFRFRGSDETDNNNLAATKMFPSTPNLSEEQRVGCWLEPGCEPGPFIIKRSGCSLAEASMLEIVHPMHAVHHNATKLLGQLGGHLYLVVTSLSQHTTTVVVVWAVHAAAAQEHPAWNKVGISAQQALHNQRVMLGRIQELPRLKGIIVASDLDIKESDIQPAETGGVHIAQVAADPRNWEEAVDGIEIILDEALQEII